MTIKYPDYDRSILSVAASVLRHYGDSENVHKTLPELDRELEKDPENVIVLLFDGLGTAALEKHLPEDAFLRRRMVCGISSVFPPTTTAATTTVQSGLSPFEHSWLGWSLYFDELGGNVDIFPNTMQGSGEKIKGFNAARRFIPYRSIFERISAADPSVETHYLSMYSDEKTFSVGSAMRRILTLTKRPGKKYIYSYWFEPDHTMHEKGVGSAGVGRIVRNVNRRVERLCAKLQNSVVAVIADHGLIDARWDYLENYPELNGMLSRAPSIEPRALSLFVKDGCRESFRALFEETFGDSFILMPREQVIDSRLFGPGEAGKRTDGFIGDFIAAATGDLCLAEKPSRHPLRGVHAGLTADEMTVPFILAKSAD